jgi:hypothetical protein
MVNHDFQRAQTTVPPDRGTFHPVLRPQTLQVSPFVTGDIGYSGRGAMDSYLIRAWNLLYQFYKKVMA